MMLEGSMKGQTQKNALTSNFWCRKLEAEQRHLVFGLSWNPQTQSLGVP